MDTKSITFGTNNIFFPKSINKDWIWAMTRKNVDLFNVIRQNMNDDIQEGIGLIALSDIEVQCVIDMVNVSKDYVIVGEDDISLAGTSIQITALIVDTI